jgi:hypothetical protein
MKTRIGGWDEDLRSEPELPPPDVEAPIEIGDLDAPEMMSVSPLDDVDPADTPENYVAPELRLDPPKAKLPDNRLKDALRADQNRQSSANVREYLRAAFTRQNPQLRNVGTGEVDTAKAQMAAERADQPKAVDPLERELMAYRILNEKNKGKVKPEDPNKALILDLDRRLKEKALVAEPKSTGKAPLNAEARAYWEKIAGKPLPPGATEDDVNRLGGFVKSENSLEQSRNFFGTRLSEERGKEQRNETKAQQGMEIPGTTRDPNVRVDDAEVRQLRDAKAETESLDAAIGNLESAIKKHGIELNPRSPGYSEISALMSDVKLKMKGPAAYQLGVLAGPDMAILDSLTGDPTSLRGAFRGPDDALLRLKTARQSAKQRLDSKLGSRGYKVQGAKKEPKWNGRAWEVDDGNP